MENSRNQPELETLDYKPEGKKPTIAELEEILEKDGCNSIEIMPNGEIRAKETYCSNCGNPKRKDRKGLPIQYCGKPCPLPNKTTEQPNQNLMIIEEIEGLLSQANAKMYDLPLHPARSIAIEEIDILQRVTIKNELRKAFE